MNMVNVDDELRKF